MPIAHAVEVLGLQEVRDAHDAGRMLQDRSEHRLLGLQAVRRQAEVALFGARLAGESLEIGVQALDSHDCPIARKWPQAPPTARTSMVSVAVTLRCSVAMT